MYVHRTLLLLIFGIFLFSIISWDWVFQKSSSWYRLYIALIIIVVTAAMVQWRKSQDKT